MAIQIRHVLPPDSFRFADKNPLRKTAEVFKIGPNNFFDSKAGARRGLFARRYSLRVTRMSHVCSLASGGPIAADSAPKNFCLPSCTRFSPLPSRFRSEAVLAPRLMTSLNCKGALVADKPKKADVPAAPAMNF
jgi:hypothetical protein